MVQRAMETMITSILLALLGIMCILRKFIYIKNAQ